MKNSSKTPASKGKTNTANDQNTDDNASMQDLGVNVDVNALGSLLESFNEDQTKTEICKLIKGLESQVIEVSETVDEQTVKF